MHLCPCRENLARVYSKLYSTIIFGCNILISETLYIFQWHLELLKNTTILGAQSLEAVQIDRWQLLAVLPWERLIVFFVLSASEGGVIFWKLPFLNHLSVWTQHKNLSIPAKSGFSTWCRNWYEYLVQELVSVPGAGTGISTFCRNWYQYLVQNLFLVPAEGTGTPRAHYSCPMDSIASPVQTLMIPPATLV